MPIFKQMAEIIPEIIDVQLASGFDNISKWKVKAAQEKKDQEQDVKAADLNNPASKRESGQLR